MPCSDVTEYLQLSLDHRERLRTFALRKNTCGAPVGDEQLLLHYVCGYPAAHVARSSMHELVPDFELKRLNDQFVLYKQLLSVQAALLAYEGRAAADRDALFALERVEYDDSANAQISGLVKVDLVTAKIRACSNCCCAKPS